MPDTDPPGGGGGAPSSAGSGEQPTVTCDDDSDCSDESACNGDESCEDGVCREGTPYCADQEEQGCTVTCSEPEEKGDAPTCEKAVTDADEDGHVADDNTCSAESDLPRDDCDDEEPATYLDAEEVCDGKDNDCDGLDDFAEGAPLGGETRTIWTKPSGESMAQFYAPVWCAGLDQYVVVWGTDQRLNFTSLNVAGEPVVEPKPLLDDGKNHSGMLFASCSEDTLGVVWNTTENTTQTLRFGRFELSAGGDVEQLDTVPPALPLFPDDYQVWGVARAGEDAWAVFGDNADSEGLVYRISSSGGVIPPPHNLGPTSWQNAIASSDGEVAVFWSRSDEDPAGVTMNWTRYAGAQLDETQAEEALVGTIPETSDGTTAVSGLSDGFYFTARTRSQRVLVAKRTSSGDGDCGPVEIPDSPYPFSGDGEIRLASANDSSAFYLISSPNYAVFRLPNDCDLSGGQGAARTALLTEETLNGASLTAVTSSPRGHLVVWQAAPNVRARAFGNAFCDTPE
jgi:hypothetical protein